jgi:hypothetical protein
MINVPTSIGEVIDKITILQIKAEKIIDKTKLGNVQKELRLLIALTDNIDIPQDLILILKKTNEQLWDIEDRIRLCEKRVALVSSLLSLQEQFTPQTIKEPQLKKKLICLQALNW